MTKTFENFFETAFGTGKPFDYQVRFATDEFLPQLLGAPTGAGKTASVLAGWMWRRIHLPATVGRRLVFCLPMRTLVEQTRDVATNAIKRLGLEKRIKVFVLMGGEVDEEWEINPEEEAIIIGTQDMLISRALNRGYAMSRFRWPVHFGLLNNDCLWAMDEIQLMGDGLATTTQLAAFRESFGTFGNSHSLWMSATLDRNWLKTVDFKSQVPLLKELTLSDTDRNTPAMARRLNAIKRLHPAPAQCRKTDGLADFVIEKHQSGTLTLIVVNRVSRALEVSAALQKRTGFESVKLIHSKFRPADRKQWLVDLRRMSEESGGIVVSTQVVEAGVDISSKLLITDLAPYASLVQRFGRCNRKGEFSEAEVYWVDRPLDGKNQKLAEKDELDDQDMVKVAAPYQWEFMEAARGIIEDLRNAAPNDLPVHHDPYEPEHVIRRRDLLDIFDTTPDLTGYDIDVSRFVRGGDERDVSVAWREFDPSKPPKQPRLFRDELCSVGIGELKDFLKNKVAWTWNALDGEWEKVNADRLRPGMSILLSSSAGGYDTQRGWDPSIKTPVQPIPPDLGNLEPEESFVDDPEAQRLEKSNKYKQSLAAHSRQAEAYAKEIAANLQDLNIPAERLIGATLHHDWGKAHNIFQTTLKTGLDSRFTTFTLAKSDIGGSHSRRHFRHELASALALLNESADDLTVYLAACHHGKVRLSIRAMPDEVKPDEDERLFARGIWDGEELPETDLGQGLVKPVTRLDLSPMKLGSENGAPSWLERMLALRDTFGVFKLAFLEALIRAADVRASINPGEDILS